MGGFIGIHRWLITRRESGMKIPQSERYTASVTSPENRPIEQGS
jgi:hypothetical protein